MLELKNVYKVFHPGTINEKVALDNINLKINDGEFVTVIGSNGATLKKIGEESRKDIERMLSQKVFLELWVKVKEHWRDSDILVSNLGYNKKDLS